MYEIRGQGDCFWLRNVTELPRGGGIWKSSERTGRIQLWELEGVKWSKKHVNKSREMERHGRSDSSGEEPGMANGNRK